MPLKTNEVMKRLADKYSSYEWIYLPELRRYNGYDHMKMRMADAIAINLYPSGGCEVHGFEVKVSRGDWLSEVKDPDKSETFKKFCDRWWLVVGDRNLVKLEELPRDWGLIQPRGDGLAVKRGASKLASRDLDMKLFTSILKRVKDEANKKPEKIQIQSGLDEAHRQGYAAGKSSQDSMIARLERRIRETSFVAEKLNSSIEEDVNKYNVDEIINLIKFGRVMLRDSNYYHQFKHFQNLLSSLSTNVVGCIEDLEGFQKDFQSADS